MCQKRIFQATGGGFCAPTDYAVNTMTGEYSLSPTRSNQQRVLASAAMAQGHIVMQPSAMQGIANTVQAAETQRNSALTAFRPESANGSSQSESTFTLIITNGETTPQRVIVGDSAETYQLANNIAAPGALVVFGGTFGANTLSHFIQRTGLGGIRVTKTQYNASSSAFYATGSVGYIQTNFDGNIKNQSTLNLTSLRYFNEQDPLTRVDESNYLFSFQNALDIKVPAGQTITLTFHIQSEATVKNMELV